jgi:hypothetical protein
MVRMGPSFGAPIRVHRDPTRDPASAPAGFLPQSPLRVGRAVTAGRERVALPLPLSPSDPATQECGGLLLDGALVSDLWAVYH